MSFVGEWLYHEDKDLNDWMYIDNRDPWDLEGVRKRRKIYSAWYVGGKIPRHPIGESADEVEESPVNE